MKKNKHIYNSVYIYLFFFNWIFFHFLKNKKFNKKEINKYDVIYEKKTNPLIYKFKIEKFKILTNFLTKIKKPWFYINYIEKIIEMKSFKKYYLKFFNYNFANILFKYKKIKPMYKYIINFKKKNLFLTFVNLENKKTIVKKNLGSLGFKNKKKFTGHSIEETSYFLKKKIYKHLKRHTNKINKAKSILKKKLKKINKKQKKLYKKKRKKPNLKILFYFNALNLIKKKKLMKKKTYIKMWKKKYKKKWKFNKRKYWQQINIFQENIYINVDTKNSKNFWFYRFFKKGFKKYYYSKLYFSIKFVKIYNILKNPHSKGRRTKKKRRI